MYYAFCTTPPLLLDAGHVLFTSLTEQGPRLAQLALDGTGLKPLLPAAAFPALDATGTRVAYLDLASGVEHVRVCNLTTGAVSRPVDLPL